MTQNISPPIRRAALFFILILVVTFAVSLTLQCHDISEYFFKTQDFVGSALAIGLLLWLPRVLSLRFGAGRLLAWVSLHPRASLWALCLGVGLCGWIGWRVVFGGYALSEDEFMALFDAEIFRKGALIAPLDPVWRPFNTALQPMFQISLTSGAAWSSSYYPVNAAALAAMDVAGLRSATGGLWAALSVGLCYRLARQLWPDTPAAAYAAALLLASSSQLIVTAMTPYAMSAHLALNLLWLNLFLARGKLSQGLALATAFAATGLHQLAFHPLFAAPFVGRLWLDRQFGRAAFHTAGYLLIAAVWTHYWDFALWTAHLDRGREIRAALDPFKVAVSQLQALNGYALQWQLENLCRATSWQNPLAFALFLVGAPLAFRAGGVERSLLYALILTTAVVTAIEPYQGHGWGYRYLHGLLGAFVIIAVRGAVSIWPTASGGLSRRAIPWVLTSALLSILVLAPVRMIQAHVWSSPYSRAHALISNAKADIVLVNSDGLAFADDLARNDPWLGNHPKVMSVMSMSPAQISAACRLGKIEIFDRTVGDQLGISEFDPPKHENDVQIKLDTLGALQHSGHCGTVLGLNSVKPKF